MALPDTRKIKVCIQTKVAYYKSWKLERGSLTHIQVVNREEGLSLRSLLFYNLNTITSYFGRGHHYGIHVMAKHLCDSELVFLVDGLAQVHQASILDTNKKIIN